MRILHLTAPVQAGGLERVVHSLAVGQQQRGHQVEVAAIIDAEGDAANFFTPLVRAGVPVHRIVVPPRSYLYERRTVRALVHAFKPDVVHSHGYRTDVVDAGMIRGLGVATVTTAHGYTAGPWRNRVYETLQRLVFRRFDAVIAVSEPLGELLRRAGVPIGILNVVPNAFMQLVEPLDRASARAGLNLPPDAFVVGWVGRMVREKGLDVLIDTLPHLSDVDLVAAIIGAGPERATQEARIDATLSARIRWAGLVPEASRYYTAFDVFVISSRTEGLPISLFEAMASEVPIVTTRVGGVPHAVTPDHAVLVDPENPAELARGIRAVHDDRDSAVLRAQRARERVFKEFGTDAWLTRHDEVYASAIRKRAR